MQSSDTAQSNDDNPGSDAQTSVDANAEAPADPSSLQAEVTAGEPLGDASDTPVDTSSDASAAGSEAISEARTDAGVEAVNETVTESGTDVAAETAGSGMDFLTTKESALDDLIGTDEIAGRAQKVLLWIQENLLTFNMGLQIAILLAALIPAAVFGPQLKKLINTQVAPRAPYGLLRRAANAFAHIATPIALYLTLQIALIVLGAMGQSAILLEAGISLLTAWIVIRLVTLVIRSSFWSKVAFYVAWPVAALDAFGLLDDIVRELDGLAIPVGQNELGQPIDFSALDLVRTIIIFGVLFWLAGFVNRFLAARIESVDELTPSLQALLIKILNILMPVLAFLIALQVVGFNLATLTIFGGAVGLGIGLGLQRTISNFIAGFTLIADKSIKPGDVIEVGDTFGWVTQMSARYVSVRTRDGMAHLIPNDKFIEDGVINWSHSDKVVRLHASFGVAYSTRDLKAIAKMAEETAVATNRVLNSPAPRCNLVEFGDSSVNFDLRFWINDPANGCANVRSDVMMAIWDRLHDMGVEIPFPQRDLHIKSMPGGFGSGALEGVGFIEEQALGTPEKQDKQAD